MFRSIIINAYLSVTHGIKLKIKKGKDFVALVEQVLADSATTDGIKEKLEDDIKRTSNKLVEQSEQRAREMEKVKERNKQKAEDIQRELGELGHQLEEKKKHKCELETKLNAYKKACR